MDWTAEASDVQRALASLDFLLGSWTGSGDSHGDPIQGRLQIRRIASGGFVEAREQLIENGEVTHEDLAIYRWDVSNQCLRVQHYSPPGSLMDHYVLRNPANGGIQWVAGPGAARVELWPEGESLSMEVFLPGEETPAQRMRYERVDPG